MKLFPILLVFYVALVLTVKEIVPWWVVPTAMFIAALGCFIFIARHWRDHAGS